MNSLRGRMTNRQSARNVVRRLQSLSLRNSATATTATTSSDADPEIQIPFRKERSATDILHALEKTISRDPTAAHYKYHDDPFLIPMSNLNKRMFALSKESGRKAAMWILQEHADLFGHKLAEPEIPAFMPKATYESKDQVSEEILMKVINEGSVIDAVTIYKLLEGDTSIETKQALLELLCFHNNEEQIPETLVEERWYRKATNRQRQTWKHSPEVDELFKILKDQDKPIAAAAYNALISGTAKYLKVSRAWALYEECEREGIPINLTTYNLLIQLVPTMRDGIEQRQALLVQLLKRVEEAGLTPNVGTLNAALKVATAINIQPVAKNLTRSLFAEFRHIGVEPSLASYCYALQVFYRDYGGPKSDLLYGIVAELQGKKFTMQDPNDTIFFVSAMETARKYLQDGALAEKIHKLLLVGDNYNFIGKGFMESIYYRHYTVLMLKTMPFEKFVGFYDALVPHIYIPEHSVVEQILETMERVEGEIVRDFLPRLWSQMTMFDQLDREPLVSRAMQLMRAHSSLPKDSPVHRHYADAAWSLWDFVKDKNETNRSKFTWSGKTLANMALLSLRADELERFYQILQYMRTEQRSFIGVADIEQLNEMFEACLERGYAPGVLDVIQYCVEAGFDEAGTMGRKLQSTLSLTVTQELQLSNLVGSEVLKTETSKDEQ